MLQYVAATGRLILGDQVANKTLLDTGTDDLLCVKPSDYRVDDQAIIERVAESSGINGSQVGVNLQEEYYLGTIDIPNARVVRGMIMFHSASDPQPGDDIWQMAGGSQVAFVDGVSTTTVPQSDLSGYARVASMGAYTIYVNELNHLILQERLIMRCRDRGSPPTGYLYRRAQTISYRLLIGFWLSQNFSSIPGLAFRSSASLSSGTSVSYTMNFGYAYTGRELCVAIGSRRLSGSPGAVPTSVTIGGISATLIDSATDGGVQGVSVWSALVPSGTSGAVVIDSATSSVISCALFALSNYTTATKSTSTGSGSNTSSVSITVPDNKVGIVVSMNDFTTDQFWAAPPVNVYSTTPPTRSDWGSASFASEGYTFYQIAGSPSQIWVSGMLSVAVVHRGAGSVSPQVAYKTQAGAAVNGDILTMGLVFN